MKESTQDDAFWRSVQDGLRAEDQLRRAQEASIAEDFLDGPCDEELSDSEIQRIVAGATQSSDSDVAPVSTASAPAPARWKLGWSRLAAAGLLLVLLAFGMAETIWPHQRFSGGGPGQDGITFPHSALLVTDHLELESKRIAGLNRILGTVKGVVRRCLGVLAKSGDPADAALRPIAQEALDEITRTLRDGCKERGPHPSEPFLEAVMDRVLDMRRSEGDRVADLKLLSEETLRGVKCVVTADEASKLWNQWLLATRAKLLKAISLER